MSELRAELQATHDRHGKLTAKLIVADARAGWAPYVHSQLEWNDEKAAERWRENQAHDLIRSVRVVYKEASPDGPEQTIRAWFSVRTENGFVYEPVEEVAADPVLSEIVLADMRREWETIKARYGHFKEFRELVRSDVT